MSKEQTKTIAQIGLIFILPIILIYLGIVPVGYRFFILSGIALITTAIIISEKWTLRDLGIRADNLKKSVLPYLGLTIVTIVAIVLLASLLDKNTQNISDNIHFKYVFIVVSFLQEFLFRSFLIPKLRKLTASPIVVIITNALLFGLIHIIFPNALFIFLLSALLGVGFALVYYFRPNLILATIAHSIINFVAVFYCFASLALNC